MAASCGCPQSVQTLASTGTEGARRPSAVGPSDGAEELTDRVEDVRPSLDGRRPLDEQAVFFGAPFFGSPSILDGLRLHHIPERAVRQYQSHPKRLW